MRIVNPLRHVYRYSFLRSHVGRRAAEAAQDVLAIRELLQQLEPAWRKQFRQEHRQEPHVDDVTAFRARFNQPEYQARLVRRFFLVDLPNARVYLPLRVRQLDDAFEPQHTRDDPDLSGWLQREIDRPGMVLMAASGAGKTAAMLHTFVQAATRDMDAPQFLPLWLTVDNNVLSILRGAVDSKQATESLAELLMQLATLLPDGAGNAASAQWKAMAAADRKQGLEQMSHWLRLYEHAPRLLVFADLNPLDAQDRLVLAQSLEAFQQTYLRHRCVVAYRSTDANDPAMRVLMQNKAFGLYDLDLLRVDDAINCLRNIREFESEVYDDFGLTVPARDLEKESEEFRDLARRTHTGRDNLIQLPLLMHWTSSLTAEEYELVRESPEPVYALYRCIIRKHLVRDGKSFDTALPPLLRLNQHDEPSDRMVAALVRLAMMLVDKGATTLTYDELTETLAWWHKPGTDRPTWCSADPSWQSSPWFSGREKDAFNEEEIAAIRAFSLLKREGNRYAFLHDSMIYILAAAGLRYFEGIKLPQHKNDTLGKPTTLPDAWHDQVITHITSSEPAAKSWEWPIEFLGGILTTEQCRRLTQTILRQPWSGTIEALGRLLSGHGSGTIEDEVLRTLRRVIAHFYIEMRPSPSFLWQEVLNEFMPGQVPEVFRRFLNDANPTSPPSTWMFRQLPRTTAAESVVPFEPCGKLIAIQAPNDASPSTLACHAWRSHKLCLLSVSERPRWTGEINVPHKTIFDFCHIPDNSALGNGWIALLCNSSQPAAAHAGQSVEIMTLQHWSDGGRRVDMRADARDTSAVIQLGCSAHDTFRTICFVPDQSGSTLGCLFIAGRRPVKVFRLTNSGGLIHFLYAGTLRKQHATWRQCRAEIEAEEAISEWVNDVKRRIFNRESHRRREIVRASLNRHFMAFNATTQLPIGLIGAAEYSNALDLWLWNGKDDELRDAEQVSIEAVAPNCEPLCAVPPSGMAGLSVVLLDSGQLDVRSLNQPERSICIRQHPGVHAACFVPSEERSMNGTGWLCSLGNNEIRTWRWEGGCLSNEPVALLSHPGARALCAIKHANTTRSASLATASSGSIKLWRVSTLKGNFVAESLPGSWSVALHRDPHGNGVWVAGADGTGGLSLWRVEGGVVRQRRQCLIPGEFAAGICSSSADPKCFVAACESGVCLFRWDTAMEEPRPFDGTSSDMPAMGIHFIDSRHSIPYLAQVRNSNGKGWVHWCSLKPALGDRRTRTVMHPRVTNLCYVPDKQYGSAGWLISGGKNDEVCIWSIDHVESNYPNYLVERIEPLDRIACEGFRDMFYSRGTGQLGGGQVIIVCEDQLWAFEIGEWKPKPVRMRTTDEMHFLCGVATNLLQSGRTHWALASNEGIVAVLDPIDDKVIGMAFALTRIHGIAVDNTGEYLSAATEEGFQLWRVAGNVG